MECQESEVKVSIACIVTSGFYNTQKCSVPVRAALCFPNQYAVSAQELKAALKSCC